MNMWMDEIEAELYDVLPKTVDQRWVERVFATKVGSIDKSLFDAICEPARDLVYSGGKRWRPLVMLLTAKMLGGDEAFKVAKKLVSLVELPHNGSLIIDDIEDQSDMRRGKPATHITHGIDISINAGNLLFYLPTLVLEEAHVPDDVKLRLYRIYAKYMRRIHLGQGMDIVWHHDINVIPSVDAYETMCRLKTGCLAAMGTEIGAAVAVDDPRIIGEAGQIAETIGLGFQILDDVINLEKGNPGKNRGDDIVENKKSLPIILYAQANPGEVDHLFTVFRHAQRHGYDASHQEILDLIGKITSSCALDKARSHAYDLFSGVLSKIEDTYRKSRERDVLVAMVQGFMDA